jgi:two-component system LytT family response regulator
MKKYKAILVDDEQKLRKVLQIKLERNCPEVNVVGTAENITEAFELIGKMEPEIVFLDISMPGGSGFDLLERFDSPDFEVIFVTGFNDYVLDALKVSAVDYLLKPVITEDLIKAVYKAITRIEDRAKLKKYELLKHNLNHIGEQETKVAIPGATAYDFVKIGDIIRCEGWQKYTRIYLQDGSRLVSSYNIGVFKDMFVSYGFYSTHKSHLVNTKLITKYHKEGLVEMVNGDQVPVSRRRKEEFSETILENLMLRS